LIGIPDKNTVMSMEINSLPNFKCDAFPKPYDILDISGQGFYRSKIIELLPSAKVIVLFIDSTEK
jgi:hypothetical protein